MGNCVSAGSTLSRKKLHSSPKTSCSGDSPLPEEIQNLISQLMQLNGLQMKPGSIEDFSGKRVKIAVTREQLEVLLRNAPALQSIFIEKGREMETLLRYNSRNTTTAEFLIQEMGSL